MKIENSHHSRLLNRNLIQLDKSWIFFIEKEN